MCTFVIRGFVRESDAVVARYESNIKVVHGCRGQGVMTQRWQVACVQTIKSQIMLCFLSGDTLRLMHVFVLNTRHYMNERW